MHMHTHSSPALQPQRLHKLRRHVLDILVLVQQLLDDGLAIVRVEGGPVHVPLVEVEEVRVFAVPPYAVVHHTRLRLREPRRLDVDGFEGVRLVGESADLFVSCVI